MMQLLTACKPPATPVVPSATAQTGPAPTEQVVIQDGTALPSPTAIPTPIPTRLLSICMGREPETLFLYQASTIAQSILQAIYDGPFDVKGYAYTPVILAGMPALADGSAAVQVVQVNPGEVIVDAEGLLNVLQEGVVYLPNGCNQGACAQAYSGDQPVGMDQLVVRFDLLPGLVWSDGVPLTADDSFYSYQVAQSLFGDSLERMARTASYQVLSETSLEWRGVPGFLGVPYAQVFYSPLPRHAWGGIAIDELLSAQESSQTPIGWGAYVIDEWVRGDHITLSRNPHYFRATENLPYFDYLVFRFVSGSAEALDALRVGECDMVDSTALPDVDMGSLLALQEQGGADVVILPETSWELALFGINSVNEERLALFDAPEVRQAIAMCVNRQAIVDRLLYGQTTVADAYLPASHPLYDPQVRTYAYDPQAAAELLDSQGWLDSDSDPTTPRIAQGVAGIADGTVFAFTYLVSPDAERQEAAQMIQTDLAACGIRADLAFSEASEYLASAPQGAVFGRDFDMAQFALQTLLEPVCSLFTTREIPGPYPEYAMGWGGANASGFSSAEFDQACQAGLVALREAPEYQQAQGQALQIFAEQLPALPLYWRYRVAATRADFCTPETGSIPQYFLQGIETFQYGEDCGR